MATRRGGSRSTTLANPADKGSRRRRLRLGLGLLALIGAIGGGALAWGQGAQYLYACERFQLGALEVRGLHRLGGGEVLAATGLAEGDNIFCVDLDTLAARVDTMVWVRHARVGRRPPDRLLVTVEERRRVAWLELAGTLYGVDVDGVLLPARRLAQEEFADLDLPVLRLPALAASADGDSDSLGPGSTLADSGLVELLNWWLAARQAKPEACASISEIEPLSDGGVRLFLVADGLEVRMPMAEAARHLDVLGELLDRVYRECPDAAYVDLRYAGQAVVGRRGTAARAPAGGGRHG